ncbi:MAG: STAS domain-containing protein [Caryophanon sp.]|nr:STAS domain-containing protein [Caryophanon sp.]
MNIIFQVQESEQVIRGMIEGELDTFTAPQLKEELETMELAEGVYVEMDLSKLNYMDSTGLGVFVGFYKRAKREQATVKLIGLSSRLRRLFEITGLSDLMEIDNEKRVELSNEGI